MIYAPIMIPTLCRSEHFIRCIESLKKNTWASNTDVYIALDYPAKESHWKGYQEICEYLKGDFSCFANFQVFKRTENYGAGKNNRVMLQWILERYDRYIRTDDDIEFSPNFLEYMDKCLMEYEEDTDVVAVSGYSYPIEWKVSEGSTALKIDCCCSMWGTGFWKNKREQLIQAIETGDFFRQNAGEFIKLGKVNQLSDARKTDFAGALTDKESLAHRMSDVAIGTYLGFAEKSVIIPAISKSRNHGFDGTGEWCPMVEKKENVMVSARNYNYKEQPFDENLNFNLIPDTLNNMEENRRRYNRFDTRSEKEINHANTKIRLYKYAGGQVLQDTAHDAKTELYQKEDIAVSVYCLVYNHEKYLRDALEGFVKQKTTFKYEVFVHDDASTDGSAEIIKEYATKYPNIIKPIFQKQNQYSQKVKIVKTFIYPHISGKYIAACEGDDYWTDEYKLQYQYEVMEAHPECSICSHYARVVEMDNKALVRFSPDKRYNACEGVMDKELQMDISMNDMFQLSSDFMRRSVYDKYTENRPEFANKMLVGDTPLLLFFAKYGSLYFIDREMSVYRRGTEGSWTKRNLWKAETRIRHVDASIEGLIACKEFFEGEYSEMFDEAVYNLKINSAVLQKNYKSAFKDIPYLIRKGRKILAMKIVVCSISPKLEIVWDKFKKFK